MKLNKLLNGFASQLPVDGRDIKGLTCDSRHVKPGYLYVAIPGHERDGAAFIGDAIQRGATAIVGEGTPTGGPKTVAIPVKDSRGAMAALAARFYKRPADRLHLIGITGTNGKTTVATLTRTLLRSVGRHPGLLSTVQYEIGSRVIPPTRTTPDAIQLHGLFAEMLAADCDSAVMEVSSHGLMQKRTEGVDFDVAVFTNLSPDHLDYHGDMESYFKAKRRLFESLGRGQKTATAVVHADDQWGRRLLQEKPWKAQVVSYGLQSGADVRAENIAVGNQWTAFRCRSPWGSEQITFRLRGQFNVINALAAIAAGGASGLSMRRMALALADVTAIPGRLEEVETMRGYQVFVDYAHTPDALENVLSTLRDLDPERLIVVFGCGGNRDTAKRAMMGTVATTWADHVIVTTDNPRSEDPLAIMRDIEAGFTGRASTQMELDRRAAIGQALTQAQDGDIVLIAGKGHETFQEFKNTTVAFDDRRVVREWLHTAADALVS